MEKNASAWSIFIYLLIYLFMYLFILFFYLFICLFIFFLFFFLFFKVETFQKVFDGPESGQEDKSCLPLHMSRDTAFPTILHVRPA